MSMPATPHRSTLRRFLPRFRLRTLLLAVLLVSVSIRFSQWAWPRFLLYRQGLEYTALQATKQSFVDQQRKRFEADKLRDPNISSMAVDRGRPIPDDFVILLRAGDSFGCFIPRNQGMKGESLEYDWYFRSDGKGTFPPDNPNVDSGHAFAGPYVTGGGSVKVKFGAFDVEWSGSFPNWGYLYFASRTIKRLPADSQELRRYEPPGQDHLRICTTDVKSVELLDARDAKWIYIAYPGDEGVPGNVDLDLPAENQED